MQMVPPFGLHSLDDLGEVGADFIIVGADIGNAQGPCFLAARPSPMSARECRLPLQPAKATAMAAAFDGATAMPSTFLATRSCTMANLLIATAVFAGSDVHCIQKAPFDSGFGLLAAITGLVKEWVVHVLRHEGKGELCLSARSNGCERTQCNSTESADIFFMFSSSKELPLKPQRPRILRSGSGSQTIPVFSNQGLSCGCAHSRLKAQRK